MQKERFVLFLQESGKTPKSISSKLSHLRKIERELGKSVETIVESDYLMMKSLKIINGFDDSHNNFKNALRHYYKFVNGDEYPSSRDIRDLDEGAIKEILSELKRDGYECFVSEAQLRDAFAIKLVEKYGSQYIVMPEYTVSNYTDLPEGLLHFDLVAINGFTEEKTVFEFKYKTSSMKYQSDFMNIELNNQSDTTNGRYAIWKDIYRIQEVMSLESYRELDVKSGFMIFIGNNKTYNASPRMDSASRPFSIEQGNHPACVKEWANPLSAVEINRNPLPIRNDYDFNYETYSVVESETGPVEFYQLVVKV